MALIDMILFWLGLAMLLWTVSPMVVLKPRSTGNISPQAIGLAAVVFLASITAHQLWG